MPCRDPLLPEEIPAVTCRRQHHLSALLHVPVLDRPLHQQGEFSTRRQEGAQQGLQVDRDTDAGTLKVPPVDSNSFTLQLHHLLEASRHILTPTPTPISSRQAPGTVETSRIRGSGFAR